MELLERDIVLDELGRLWEEARQGSGRFVFLGGEAGVGKTSVVRAFGDRLAGAGRSLIGWCDPLSTPRPLGPLIDMASSAGGELERLIDEGVGRDRLLRAVLAE